MSIMEIVAINVSNLSLVRYQHRGSLINSAVSKDHDKSQTISLSIGPAGNGATGGASSLPCHGLAAKIYLRICRIQGRVVAQM